MKTDIEIAQEAKIEPITSIAETLGITTDELELYGKYKAKLSEEYLEKLKGRPDGKLILITAIVPLVCYNKMAQKTVVERLRIAE